MAVDFRCEKCGKLLSVEAAPGATVACPYCHAQVAVPAGVASLPRPQVPPGGKLPAGQPARPSAPAGQPAEEDQEQPVVVDDTALMSVMAKVMPWVISLFFHAGIGVLLAFIYIVVYTTEGARAQPTVPDAELSDDPGGQLDPGDTSRELDSQDVQDFVKRDSTIPMANTRTDKQIQVYGFSGPSSGGSPNFGLTTGGTGRGPRSAFMGTGGNAYHIVYVVDRSGSMLDTFDMVRAEMFRSITRLSDTQTFHVIFFASGRPMENPPRRLVYATEAYKREANRYLKTIQPQGQTDPLPALQRAFEVLDNAPNQKAGKLIYLLTDGEFPDNEKVEKSVKAMNAGGKAHINTILHWHRNEEAIKVLRKIANENGGKFKFVESSD